MMLADAELRGKPKRKAHALGDEQWLYNDNLARTADFEPIPDFYRLGFKLWNDERTNNPLYYKMNNLTILDNGAVMLTKPDDDDDDNESSE